MPDLFNPPATRVLPGLNATGTTDVGVTSRRGADRTSDGRPYSCTVLSLLALARHLGYGFLPVPRVDLATIAAAVGDRQEAARILRDEVCNRSDNGKPPLELSERTEQIMASRDWLSPMKSAS